MSPLARLILLGLLVAVVLIGLAAWAVEVLSR